MTVKKAKKAKKTRGITKNLREKRKKPVKTSRLEDRLNRVLKPVLLFLPEVPAVLGVFLSLKERLLTHHK